MNLEKSFFVERIKNLEKRWTKCIGKYVSTLSQRVLISNARLSVYTESFLLYFFSFIELLLFRFSLIIFSLEGFVFKSLRNTNKQV